MVAEFGEPGVENTKLMDLITVEPASGDVVLVMIERRRWETTPLQLRQMEDKINRYLAYALDGFLVEHHPKFLGKKVRIRLDCAEAPHGEAVAFLEAATHAIRAEGLDFEVNVTPPAAPSLASPPSQPPTAT
jgi:hypothetical protein